MNGKQSKVGFLVLVAVTIVTIVAYYQHVQSYEVWLQEITDRATRQNVEDIFDPPHWFAWGAGSYIVLSAVVTVDVWILFSALHFHNWRRLRSKKLLLILLVASFFLASTNTASAYLDTTVDILFLADEELWSATEPWPVPFLPWWYDRNCIDVIREETFPYLAGIFKEELGITLQFHGWQTWTSTDSYSDPYDVLQEGIEDSERGIWVVDPEYEEEGGGYWKFDRENSQYDIMVFCTRQHMDYGGLGPPEWGAAVIYYGLWMNAVRAIEHEMTHLYGIAGHCHHADCIMNKDTVIIYAVWEWDCKTYMQDHTDYFDREVPDPEPHGGRVPEVKM